MQLELKPASELPMLVAQRIFTINTVTKQKENLVLSAKTTRFEPTSPVVVITPPPPWDGGTARTAIQVHAINLIELG